MTTPVVPHLNNLGADATVLFTKVHNYHWNVRGPGFFTLHEKFEELYDELADQLDEIAERVLQLGARPVGSLRACLELTVIEEETENIDAETMVHRLLGDLESFRSRVQAAITAAQETNDRTTENILDDIIDSHAKHVWMFGAYLGQTVREK